MLFKQVHLDGVQSGAVTLAFRKWKQPAVKKGSLIKTSIGIIQILSIQKTTIQKITAEDALAAGYSELSALLRLLNKIQEGDIYRIKVSYYAVDPRIALREQTTLSDEAFEDIRQQLFLLDRASRQGDWTIVTLMLIQEYPQLRAADLAQYTGREKEWLKLNIRKLKDLGLTISHHPGYTLSPLGRVVLARMFEETNSLLQYA